MSADDPYLEGLDEYLLSGRRMPEEPDMDDDMYEYYREQQELSASELDEMARKYAVDADWARACELGEVPF